VRSLCRPVPPLFPTDPLAKAVETIRLSTLGSLPLVTAGRLLALVSEADLSRIVLASSDDSNIRLMPLQLFLPALSGLEMHGGLVTLHQDTPLTVAANIFRERPDLSVIPILDDHGLYMGVVTRADLMAALCKTLAPPRVGGMATPLGVYLTDGVEAGGAGNVGLFLTGISLSLLYFVALLLAALSVIVLHRWTHTDLDLAFFNFLARHSAGLGAMVLVDLRTTLSFPFMLILLRLVPISGYHAAEHQVVHCIERGEPLLPQIVARMPRPHPRCGTNLVAAFTLLTLFLVLFAALVQNIEIGLMAAVIATLAFWRPVGSFLQQYLTTRPASPRQIESGIRAGEEILAKYRRGVNKQGRFLLRIWRMGLLQILAGSALVLGIMWVLTDLFPAFSRLLGSF
jgi:CBS domain-containing protein